MLTITHAMKRAAIEREINLRRRVCKQRVYTKRMSQFAAEQIAIMEAVLADYPPEPPAQRTLFNEV